MTEDRSSRGPFPIEHAYAAVVGYVLVLTGCQARVPGVRLGVRGGDSGFLGLKLGKDRAVS